MSKVHFCDWNFKKACPSAQKIPEKLKHILGRAGDTNQIFFRLPPNFPSASTLLSEIKILYFEN